MTTKADDESARCSDGSHVTDPSSWGDRAEGVRSQSRGGLDDGRVGGLSNVLCRGPSYR